MPTRLSLRARLLFSMGALVSVILVISGALDIWAGHRTRVSALRLRAKLVAKAQAAALSSAIWEYDQDAAVAALDGSLQDREFSEAFVVDDTGTAFAQVKQASLPPGPDPISVKQPIELVTPGGEKRALGSLEMRYSRHLLDRRLRIALLWALGQLLALVAVVTAGMAASLRIFTRPIEEMTEVIRRRARGDLSLDVNPAYLKRDDEIGAIAQSLELDQQQRRDEARLLEVTSDVSAEAHVSAFLRRLAAAGKELLAAGHCAVFVHDQAHDVLWWAPREGEPRVEIKPGQGLAGHCFASGQVLKVDDAQEDPRFLRDKGLALVPRSVLCVPLITKTGARIGVFEAINKAGGPFIERDELRVRALAAQAAIALENARLLDAVLDEKAYSESILGSLSDGVVSLDQELRVATVNAAAARLFRWREDEVRAQPLRALLPDAENDFELELIQRVAETGKPDAAEDTELMTADGRLLTVNLNAVPLRSAKGESIGSLVVVEDITSEKRVRGTMARYLPRKVIDQLLEGDRAALGGTAQTVTALFSDIRGFTTISEEIGARATVAMLNEYFTEMLEVLDEHNGILDKFIGDAVMAIFGVPFAGESDADNAVNAANGMISTLQRLNGVRAERKQPPIAIGVGLNTGEVVAGNIGSPKRMSYTVIGDSVNLASRLEGATKLYGGSILLSEFTYRALRDTRFVREVDVIRVKGKTQPVAIYESYAYRADREEDGLRRSLDLCDNGLHAFRIRDWAAARRAFSAASDLTPRDPLASVYLRRLDTYQAAPPPDDWDGVWTMTAK